MVDGDVQNKGGIKEIGVHDLFLGEQQTHSTPPSTWNFFVLFCFTLLFFLFFFELQWGWHTKESSSAGATG